MANSLYTAARQAFLTQGIHWENDVIKVMLIGNNYSPDYDRHANLSDIGTTYRMTVPVTLENKQTAGGAADADDVTFTSVGGTTSITAILIYKDTGSESTSTLIAYIDAATGLPITPNGGDIIITWDNGVNKIFRV